MTEIRIKRGEALSLSVWVYSGEAPIDLGHVTLSAQVRTPDDTLVAVLTLVKQAVTGLATILVLDTTQWPLGRLRGDLRLVIQGQASLTETFAIAVARQVTQ